MCVAEKNGRYLNYEATDKYLQGDNAIDRGIRKRWVAVAFKQ